MRRRITDLFKKLFSPIKHLFTKPKVSKLAKVKEVVFQPERKKVPSKWVLSHNMIQAKDANKLKRRRAKNKIAKQSRKINRAA